MLDIYNILNILAETFTPANTCKYPRNYLLSKIFICEISSSCPTVLKVSARKKKKLYEKEESVPSLNIKLDVHTSLSFNETKSGLQSQSKMSSTKKGFENLRKVKGKR